MFAPLAGHLGLASIPFSAPRSGDSMAAYSSGCRDLRPLGLEGIYAHTVHTSQSSHTHKSEKKRIINWKHGFPFIPK